MMSKKKAPILLVLSLSACASTYQQNAKKLDNDNNFVNKAYQSSSNVQYQKSFSMVKVYKEGVYIGMKSFMVKQGESLPVRVEAEGVKLYSSRKMTLADIAKLITTATGIPVSITDGKTENAASSSASGDGEMFKKLNAIISDSVSPQAQMNLYDNLPGLDVDYKGKLSGFLKLVSSYYGISWQYLNGIIYFSPYEVKTFNINTMPVKLTSQSSLNLGMTAGGSDNGGSGDGSGGGGSSSSGSNSAAATNNTTAMLETNIWDDIKKNLSVILNKNGSYNVAEGLASITVSTTPENMTNVQRYIDKLNEHLRQEISVNVTIYNLTLDENSSWNFSLTDMFSALKGRISGSMNFIPGAKDGGLQGTTSNGSSFILNMLNSQGKVDVLNSANITTMSGQQVPFLVANTRGYVSSLGSTTTNQTTSTNMKVSTINSGYSLSVLPRILDDGKILMQYAINMSSLVGKNNGFDEFKVDNQVIQLPNVNQRSFVQQSLMNNNQTLVVAGYKNDDTNNGDQGVGSPDFKLLGGGRSAQKRKEIIIISIKPTALSLGDK